MSLLLALGLAAALASAQDSPPTQRYDLVCVFQDTKFDAATGEIRRSEKAKQKSLTVSFDRGNSPKIDISSVVLSGDVSIVDGRKAEEFTFSREMDFGIFFPARDGSLIGLVGSPTEQKRFRTSVLQKSSDGKISYPMAGLCALVRSQTPQSK